MTADDIRAIAGAVYRDEIVRPGMDRWWDQEVYDAIVAGIPRHDAPIEVQQAYAGLDELL